MRLESQFKMVKKSECIKFLLKHTIPKMQHAMLSPPKLAKTLHLVDTLHLLG